MGERICSGYGGTQYTHSKTNLNISKLDQIVTDFIQRLVRR